MYILGVVNIDLILKHHTYNIPANKSISLHALLMYYSYHDLLPVIKKPLESLN